MLEQGGRCDVEQVQAHGRTELPARSLSAACLSLSSASTLRMCDEVCERSCCSCLAWTSLLHKNCASQRKKQYKAGCRGSVCMKSYAQCVCVCICWCTFLRTCPTEGNTYRTHPCNNTETDFRPTRPVQSIDYTRTSTHLVLSL